MKSIEELKMDTIVGGINCFAVGLLGWFRMSYFPGSIIQITEAYYCWNT